MVDVKYEPAASKKMKTRILGARAMRAAIPILILLCLSLQGGCSPRGISCEPIRTVEEVKTLEPVVDPMPQWAGTEEYHASPGLQNEKDARIAYFKNNSEDLALMIHGRINQVRREHGMDALQWDPELAEIALSHSADMAARNYFGHVSPEGEDFSDRYRERGYYKTTKIGNKEYVGGENLFLGNVVRSFTYNEDTGEIVSFTLCGLEEMAQIAVDGWMESPGHRENILTPFTREGIGIWTDGDGEVYVTQNFS